jgi:hypothetical protein
MQSILRERLTYLAMSFVVGWHSLAIIVAPSPDGSAIMQALRTVVQPYLSLFRLDNKWNFFVPVGKHMQFRYVVESADGTRHVFIPVAEPSDSVWRYVMWREVKYFYEGISESVALRTAAITPLLCQKHASLKPVSISFMLLLELEFSPEHYLQGRRPLDPEFVTVNALASVQC